MFDRFAFVWRPCSLVTSNQDDTNRTRKSKLPHDIINIIDMIEVISNQTYDQINNHTEKKGLIAGCETNAGAYRNQNVKLLDNVNGQLKYTFISVAMDILTTQSAEPQSHLPTSSHLAFAPPPCSSSLRSKTLEPWAIWA